MKKIFSLLLGVVLVVSLAACDLEQPSKEENQSKPVAESSVEKEDTFSLNETAVFSNLKFTANEIKESNGEGFFTPDDGNVFVAVNFTVENISDEEQNISSILLFDAYVDDEKCEYSVNANCAFDSGTLDGSIAPGKKMTGWYALEVPKDWSNLEMHVSSNWLSGSSAKFVFTK